MNKKLLIALLGLCLAMAAAGPGEDESSYTINQASDILHQLLETAESNLVDLHNAWDVKKPLLEAAIAQLETDLSNKQDECAALDQVLADREKELKDAQDYGHWLEDRIKQNTEDIQKKLDERCQQNGAFVESLKNDQIALKLVQFLRLQIQSKDSFDEVGGYIRKTLLQNIQNFIAIYRMGNYEQLALLEKQLVDASQYDITNDQSVQDRTAEEIGVGHVDNNVGDLNLDSFQNGQRKGWLQVQQEMLDILNHLEVTINNKIAQGQADEIRSSTAVAALKLQLEHEIEVFQRDLEQVNQRIAELIVLVAQDKENVNTCRAQEAAISKQLDDAREDLANQTAEFERKKAGLEQEVEDFKFVVDLYDETHTAQGDDFKDRVEDFQDNNEFDDGAYNDRQVPKIDLLNH